MKPKRHKPGQFVNVNGHFCRVTKVKEEQPTTTCQVCKRVNNSKRCISHQTRMCLLFIPDNCYPKIIKNGSYRAL